MQPKKIVVISQGIIHPLVTGRVTLHRMLRRQVRSQRARFFREARFWEALLPPGMLVGSGVLAIHSASARIWSVAKAAGKRPLSGRAGMAPAGLAARSQGLHG